MFNLFNSSTHAHTHTHTHTCTDIHTHAHVHTHTQVQGYNVHPRLKKRVLGYVFLYIHETL